MLHLDRHLVELLAQYRPLDLRDPVRRHLRRDRLVVTPFLPGDSLLFAVGALAAVDTTGTLSAPASVVLLGVAAVLGKRSIMPIGRLIGPPAFSGRYRLLKVEYLRRTEEFFARYGGMAIALSRFMPIIRTFMPFVAGVGRMPYARFQAYNVAGGVSWVTAVRLGRLSLRQHPGREAQLRHWSRFHHRRVAAADGRRRFATAHGRALTHVWRHNGAMSDKARGYAHRVDVLSDAPRVWSALVHP